jgi:hypothetical protein
MQPKSARRTDLSVSLPRQSVSSTQPSLDAATKLDEDIKTAQAHYSHIVEINGGVVTIRCHICKTNAAASQLQSREETPFLGLKWLHRHCRMFHNVHDEVKGRACTREETVVMCEKYSISKTELIQIARGVEPCSDIFKAKSSRLSESKLR